MHLLGRAEKVDLLARIHGSKGVSAHLGTISERHTEKTASLSLDFREKDPCCKLLKSCTLYRVVTLAYNQWHFRWCSRYPNKGFTILAPPLTDTPNV
eukprot:scaffold44848_cov66-Phaeocystis_antarctica.AAC.7